MLVEESRAVYLSEDRLRQTRGQMPGPRTLSVTHQQPYRRRGYFGQMTHLLASPKYWPSFPWLLPRIGEPKA